MKKLTVLTAVLLISMMAGTAMAEMGLMGFAPRVSYVSPSDLDAALGVGIVVDLGEISPGFGLETSVDYWSSSIEGLDGWDISDFVVGARVRYDIAMENSGLTPYVAGGLAMHFLSADTPDFVFGETLIAGGSTSDSEFGFDLAGGIKIPSSETMDFILEAGYRSVSDFDQFVISGAVNIKMGN